MRTTLLLLVSVCCAAAASGSGRAQAGARSAPQRAAVADEILRVVREVEKAGATVGLFVTEAPARVPVVAVAPAAPPAPLVAWREAEPFVPASNQKILTCSAALVQLTADHLFTTRFAAGGATKDGVLTGPLVVTAGGDPCLSSRAGGYPPASLFARLAKRLEERGIRKIAGGLVALVADYPLPYRPASWPQDQFGFAYSAPSAGLVLQEGCLDLTIDPASGDTAALRFEPAGLPLAVRGRITVTDDRKAGGKYGAALVGDTLRLSGACWRRAGPTVARIPVGDPESVFLQALRSGLVSNGVDVEGEDVVLRTAVEEPLASATLFEQRTPIAPALRAALTDSSNFHAEMLLRALGRRGGGSGSLEDGCRALRAFLARYPTGSGELVVADGSGLSKENRVSPRIVATVLGGAVAAGDDGHVLVASLAVGGATGTLEDRFTAPSAAGRVRAKTGWVRGASSLSGIADTRSGRRWVFSILMNYDPRRDGFNRELKEWQERIVNLLLDT